jgi:hypothetical protein
MQQRRCVFSLTFDLRACSVYCSTPGLKKKFLPGSNFIVGGEV